MALERSAVGDFEEDHALVGVRKLEAGGHYSVAGGMHPAASATAAKLGTAAATSAAKAAAGPPQAALVRGDPVHAHWYCSWHPEHVLDIQGDEVTVYWAEDRSVTFLPLVKLPIIPAGRPPQRTCHHHRLHQLPQVANQQLWSGHADSKSVQGCREGPRRPEANIAHAVVHQTPLLLSPRRHRLRP